jgi:hypothetical protein
MAAPHASSRTAHTSSNEQVRRPVYTSSVGRWQLYAARGGRDDGSGDGESGGDGGDLVDLEALAQRTQRFPAAALLARVLSFEPAADRNASRRDLARTLPCRRDARRDGGGGGADARWPGLDGIARV